MEHKQRISLVREGRRLGRGRDRTRYITLRNGAVECSRAIEAARVATPDRRTAYEAKKELEGIWNTVLSAEGLKKITGKK